nr:DUF4422 domain-containing protein [uncultured Bacteroides sp.]
MTDKEYMSKIIVCAHKQDFFISDDLYMPIQVGKSISNVDLEIQGDNSGDNISKKNREYCELTAHYWAWKNLKGIDQIGLAHYRRYLDFSNNSSVLLNAKPKSEVNSPKTDFNKLLDKYDIVLSNYDYHAASNKIHYCYKHILEDYEILRESLAELFPEYLPSFDHIMIRNNKASVGNMFFTKWAVFDAYSEWLFTLLFEVEKRVKLSPYDYQRRVFGFMAERLIDVYCHYNKLKVKRCPILYVADDYRNKSALDYNFRKIKKNVMFHLSSKRRL